MPRARQIQTEILPKFGTAHQRPIPMLEFTSRNNGVGRDLVRESQGF